MTARICAALALLIGTVPAAAREDAKADTADTKSVYLDLFKGGKLFDKKEYKTVRAAVSRAFEASHKVDIDEGLGADKAALNEFFEKYPDIKEEFYTALDENNDDIVKAVRLFADLWKYDAMAVRMYPNLATAVALVWDRPREDVYDYRNHQVRTHSKLPPDVLKVAGLDNFRYFVDGAKSLQGKEAANRLQFLPWEFQVYLVDTRTPISEREWAAKNYLNRRAEIGKSYQDIQYDNEMLKTNSKICKLDGQDYTLPAIRKYGGVCAMQADYAARVAKSVAVPAAYVSGASESLGQHAWLMFVHVTGVQKDKVNFLLESSGRYLGDNYYTGTLKDPQTGQKILDRDMERRLSAVAQDRTGKRLSDLNNRIYQVLLDELKATKKRTAFLDANLKLCQYNEASWLEFAELVKNGDLSAEQKLLVLNHWNQMLTGFAKYPDFTWKVSPDIALINKESKPERNAMYRKLIDLYEKAHRPDLACDARLKWAELVEEDNQYSIAATGLNQTILKFPNEGRYIPKLVTELVATCEKYPEGKTYLTKTYIALLSAIKPTRGSSASKYALKMYEDGLAFLEKDKKNEKTVQLLRSQLAALQAKQ